MPNFYLRNRKALTSIVFCLVVHSLQAQQLKLKDFAIWGGSAPATSYNNGQGVFLSPNTTIAGAVGSNHQIRGKKGLRINGNVVSGNEIVLADSNIIAGDLFATKKAANFSGNVISSGFTTNLTGSILSNGKVAIQTGAGAQAGFVTGVVKVPAPLNTNYTGPTPAGGILEFLDAPALPLMPNNTPFDNKAGSANISTSRSLTPGAYKTLSLSGGKRLVLSPGNYIFSDVKNIGKTNEIVFDFKGSTAGTINIYVIKDANWGKIAARIINGGSPARIFTEVHGNGSTNSGNAFFVGDGSQKTADVSVHNWIGAVWVPNGGISIGTTDNSNKSFVHLAGAFWSGTKVTVATGITIAYTAPLVEPSFVDPLIPPPLGGKVPITSNIIGAELFSLTQSPTAINSNSILQIDNGNVMIEVISKEPNDVTLRGLLIELGMTGLIDNGPHTYVITGSLSINKIPELNTDTVVRKRISYVRPLFLPLTNIGQVTSQGDVTMRSDKVRERFGLDGQGVKVGVLSDSYNNRLGAQADIDEGDLPGRKSNGELNPNPEPVQVLLDYPGSKSDEGRAMIQIVNDVCTGCKTAFRTGFLTAGDFANGIKALASPTLEGGKCDIIVDDVTYITEPFLRDGIVAQTVNEVVAGGVSYFTSAGNFGQRSYEKAFSGVSNASVLPFPATIHKFGASNAEIYQTLKLKPGNYTIVLQWDDDFHTLGSVDGVKTDLDLYLLNSTGFPLFGFNRSNLFGDPFEVCPFVVREETEAKLMIANATGNNTNVRFKYIIFAGDGTIVDYQSGSSTIVGHANAEGAITVGAMLYANIPPFTSVYPGVASFSSRGGTFTHTGTTYAPRQKPNIIAPNGGNISFALNSNVFDDGDRYFNFFGTSASAPHAAAAAALFIQGRKKFDLREEVTPAELKEMLQNSAGRFPNQTSSHDYINGFGFLQADVAIREIANARPIILSWEPVLPGTQPGTLPFQVKVKGEYLSENTLIYFNGTPINPSTVSADRTEVVATIPSIAPGEDPPLQLFNAAKSPSTLDGGLSEALHFFSSRVDVKIRAENKTGKYKQQNPAFTAEVFVDGVPINQTSITLADLKLDDENIIFSTFATPESNVGLYSISPSRRAPLAANDPLLSAYSFTFVSGTFTKEKMPLLITPRNQTIKYGDYLGEVVFDYEFDRSQPVSSTFLDEVKLLHKRYMADNGLAVINGFETQLPTLSPSDFANMSLIASFQAVRNAKQFSLNNGQLKPVVNTLPLSDIGNQRFLIDVSAQSLTNYKINAGQANMVAGLQGENARALLSIKSLADGSAKAAVPNGQLQPIVNGQLLAMVNGQLQAVVNGQLKAIVNREPVDAADIIFQNGQLLALVNTEWVVATNGQLQAVVNGQSITTDLSVLNGQLRAVVNGQLMAVVNGQLQAVVNGQLIAVVNGQLQAVVNGQLLPVVNGQLLAMVNGQLQPVVNGQLLAVVNGQLMAVVNETLEIVESLTLSNGQLWAVINGQLQPVVNGQLRAMVNGEITNVPDPVLVNGQLQAVVNGQLQAIVNGQLRALVNGQLQPIVNGDLIPVSSVRQLANGQLKAVVNSTEIPLKNGQLQAVVNGQLMAMVNGQLMAVVNGELTFAVIQNGQLKAVVNGQLQAVVNGQLQAIVNNQVTPVDSYTITNGQLQAVVNGETMMLVNNQLLAFANGQLQPVVNNFDVSGTNNNAKTLVLVDQDDINLQGGSIGGMFAVNMITGLTPGTQKLIPAAFTNENYAASYNFGEVVILPRPLVVKPDDITKVYGEVNPPLTMTGSGFSYDEGLSNITVPAMSVAADNTSGAGQYPIVLSGGSATNYDLILQAGALNISKKSLTVIADSKTRTVGEENPELTISYEGFVNGDTKDDICSPVRPKLPKAINQLERTSTYTEVKLNNETNKLSVVPGALVRLTANWSSIINEGELFCPGCITQHYIGIKDVFTDCHDVSGSSGLSGTIDRTFSAPTTPGIYYITQIASWEFSCYGRGTGYNFGNNAADAIAVIVVQNEKTVDSIFASTIANVSSPAGSYPITLTGCSSANYDVTYLDGVMQVNGPAQRNASSRKANITKQEDNLPKKQEQNSLKSYVAPNPATTSIKVQVANEVISASHISITDMLGRLQRIKNIKKLSGKSFEIDVSTLPQGVYFIKVRTAENEETLRFLKL